MSRSMFYLPVLAAALSTVSGLSAQLPLGVVPGDLIRIRSSASAPWLTGRAIESRNDSLVLERHGNAGVVGLGRSEIVALQRGTRHAATGKGALIGLGAGAALGIGIGLLVGASDDSFIGCPADCVVAAGGFFGLIGAGAGALIGAASHTTRWVDLGPGGTQMAITPIVTGRGMGAKVTLRWGGGPRPGAGTAARRRGIS
jgi:hypothetical protein